MVQEKDTHTFTLWNRDIPDEEKGPMLQNSPRKVTGKSHSTGHALTLPWQKTLSICDEEAFMVSIRSSKAEVRRKAGIYAAGT